MKGTMNLTEGPIAPTLLKLTLPIIATNFISTTYGLVDMIWVGKLGSDPVAAIGTASFFVNLAVALSTMITIGTGIKVAQSIGGGREEQAGVYIKNGFLMSIILSLLYMVIIFTFKKGLIGFFGLDNEHVETMAIQFLLISMIGIGFSIINTLFSTIINSLGNSKRPFKIFTIGFLINMLLDPLLIFGLGPIPALEVKGAAIATLIANIFVTILFVFEAKKTHLFAKNNPFKTKEMSEVITLGIPITIQRVTFTIISIIIAKIIVNWGPEAIAVQKVGIQIESISYMTIGGLQGAIAAFFGQNYGARKIGRIREGYHRALLLTMTFLRRLNIISVYFISQTTLFIIPD
ncbi:MATE family efflux transporter [Paenibacillus sp. D2_2]|uniref:MATE family efflux transporter n=1 Tax=Paenibacillus sp. D2_2 TaxID=3073092 RepID=UPI002815B68A|nr:MATE family efflux transporter [Paenibacillus sp. D2_2]WMT43256.1 MATE family efflux transporter [Paenibacillus sp. D2_2]